VVQLKVFRLNPEKEEDASYVTYEIEGQDSLLMALRFVREHIDPSLAFRDFHCAKGVCGSCIMRVDGKPRKACETMLISGRTYLIEPLEGKRIIKDLVVREG
jgi:succinate dehydrogenase/fumarate reductase-like Fe-S protein